MNKNLSYALAYLCGGVVYQLIGYGNFHLYWFATWLHILFWPVYFLIHAFLGFILVPLIVLVVICIAFDTPRKFVMSLWADIKKKIG